MDRTRKLALTLFALGPAQSAWAAERIFFDGFDAPAAFRETDQDLRDPHVFVNVGVCLDVTETFNNTQQTNIQNDGNADTFLDASYLHLLQPLDTVDGGVGVHDSLTANCTAPMASTSCSSNGSAPYSAVYTTQTTGTCLGPVAGSIGHPYSPTITNAIAPCFATAVGTVTLNLQGTPLTLQDASIAATWSGSPANQLSNGLMRGFVTEADANNTVIAVPGIGNRTLSSLLAGGTNSCQTAWDDKDLNNGVSGWWFYVNFSAAKVPYTP